MTSDKDTRSTAQILAAGMADAQTTGSLNLPPSADNPTRNAADILAEMADTYRQRNAVYGDNYNMVGPVMKILFPKGVPPELLGSHQFHLFELVIVKLSRLAVSQLTHQDSARDAGVYAAMIESIIEQEKKT